MNKQGQTRSRRHFLQTLGATAATLSVARHVHAAGSDMLRIGLVGCGGRGCGATLNALDADPGTTLVALGDAFDDRLAPALAMLSKARPGRVAVPTAQGFSGFDAYRHVIEAVDVVLLATPSHFHPIHLEAAVAAGRHVFVEKPHGVDAPQVRQVQAACEQAKAKKLSVLSGLCWRFHRGAVETMKRLREGAIGEIMSVQATYMTGFSWTRPRMPDDSEMKYQMRNWYNFTWLSGDLPGLTLIHSMDKGSWAFADVPPLRAWALGGRQVRTAREYGDVYDHHAVVFEYPDNKRMYAYCRQQAGCHNGVEDLIQGTTGRCELHRGRITGANEWQYKGPNPSMHAEEHVALFKAIRNGTPLNSGSYMALSTMLAVMARMAAHTGQVVTWDEAIKSDTRLAPASYDWNAAPPIIPDAQGDYPVPKPGIVPVAPKAKEQK